MCALRLDFTITPKDPIQFNSLKKGYSENIGKISTNGPRVQILKYI